MAYSLRIYWAGSVTGLSSLATSNTFVEIRLQNLNSDDAPESKCVVTKEPCEMYLRDPSDEDKANCLQSHSEVVVLRNDPTCSDADNITGKRISICLQPGKEVNTRPVNGTYLGENTTYEGTPAGPPRNKVLFTTVVAVFQKGQGGTKMLAEQEWSNSLWRTDSSCGDSAYLNNTSNDFYAWECQKCPEGVSCSGNRVWSEVKAKFGWYRLTVKDRCPPNDRYCENGPAEFLECEYPAACLGDPNPDLKGQFFDEYDVDIALNPDMTEECNGDLGFNRTCFDRYTGKEDSCRVCRTCQPGYWMLGVGECIQCAPLEETVMLSLAMAGIMILVLFLFLKSALAETEEMSQQSSSSHGHLAQSLQKIILNHIQLISLAGSFPLRWPPAVNEMFKVAKVIGSSSSYMFNPQCYTKEAASEFDVANNGFSAIFATSPFFGKQLFILFLPIISVAMVTFFWGAMGLFEMLCGHHHRRIKTKMVKKWAAKKAKQARDKDMKTKRKLGLKKTQSKSSKALKRATSAMSMMAKFASGDNDLDGDGDEERSGAPLSRSLLRTIFNAADHQSRGHLNRKQFKHALANHGHELGRLWSEKEIREIFGEMCDPSSKLLNFGSFVACFVRHQHREKEWKKKVAGARRQSVFGARTSGMGHVLKGGTIGETEDADSSRITRRGSNEKTDEGTTPSQGSAAAAVMTAEAAAARITHFDKWVATVIALCYLLYPNLCNAVFATVGCRYVGKHKYYAYIQMDMQQRCFDEQHWWVIGSLTVPAFFAYVLGIPLVFFVLLWRSRKHLTSDIHAKFRFSTLLVGYREERYYWEAVISLRKALIVAVSVFLLQAGVRVQTLAAQSLTACLLVLHTHMQPFVAVTKHRNPLHLGDFMALITAFLTLSAGMYLFQNVGESDSFQAFLTFVIIFVNLCYMGIVSYWYMALRLVDMENELVNAEGSKACTSRIVMLLQHCIPDWRARASREEVEEVKLGEKAVVHNVDLGHVLRVKAIAEKWRLKSRQHSFERQAREIEEDHRDNSLKMVRKLEKLRIEQSKKLEIRKAKRRASMEQRRASMAQASGGKGPIVIGKVAKDRALKEAEATWRASLTKIEVKLKQKLTNLGFRLSQDLKERVVVRNTENWDVIRDGAELCFVGDVDIRGEKMKSIVRLLQTLPRPLTLCFDESNAKAQEMTKKAGTAGKKFEIVAAEDSGEEDAESEDEESEDDSETI